MEINSVLLTNYLPYSKGVIISRAIPGIDGLKPAQRRILYTMYKMGLLTGNKTKSSNIVGQSMQLHPHGDMSIYETMVRMASGNEALNVPYIESKGNFGKVYSKDLAFAAPRYTEAKLAQICTELFEGIDEDAVDMIDNFDNTKKEPTMLPVKFPSILVNPSNGIAVGTSSSIPSFALTSVCDATIGILNGSITTVEQLMKVLGTPEFTTGGYVHADDSELENLGKTGRQSFVVSGSVTTYPNMIVINEIPYKTTSEAITQAIEDAVKNGELKEVADVRDDTDLKGFRMVIELKRNASSSDVLAKLCRLTPLRTAMSFNTRVIINDECKELGLLELLDQWIAFRIKCINRVYKFKLNKALTQEHLLETWEKIKGNIVEVVKIIVDNDEVTAKAILNRDFNLDNTQSEHLLEMKIRMISNENSVRKLKELEETRVCIKEYKEVISRDDKKKNIIIDELTKIKTKFGTPRKTNRADHIEETHEKEKVFVDDSVVHVILTKSGYIKRLSTAKDMLGFELPSNEQEYKRWSIKNNSYILVFTYSGECHKILVDSIDASRGGLKDKLSSIIGISDDKQILFVDSAEDFTGYFNLVYPNGRGARIYYNKLSGNRAKYKSLFEAKPYGNLYVTKANKFFMITAKKKAAYCDLSNLGLLSNRVAFKVARVSSGDRIFGLQPEENVPNISEINIDRYSKDYCVSIGNDILWKK